MNELIKLSQSKFGEETVETVNARNLHAFVEVGTAFKDWITRRIGDYAFKEGSDFCSFLSESTGGRPSREYFLTLDMAKELSMVERNEPGKQARQYFIACEKQLRQPPQLNDPLFLRDTLLTYTERVIALEAQVEEQKPMIEALDRIATAEGSLCITDAAKSLQIRPKALFSYLQEHGWIYKRTGNAHYLGYQTKVASGVLEHKVTTVLRADGSEKITEQVRVTPKGLAKLALLIPPVAEAA